MCKFLKRVFFRPTFKEVFNKMQKNLNPIVRDEVSRGTTLVIKCYYAFYHLKDC